MPDKAGGFRYFRKKNREKKIDNIYPGLAKEYNLNLIPFLLEGIVLKSEFNQDDGIHPNEKGTLILSKTLQKSIINLIKK